MTGPEPWLAWAGSGTRVCLTASIESFVRNAAEAGRSPNVVVALDVGEAELHERYGGELERIRSEYNARLGCITGDLRTAASGKLSRTFDSDLLEFALLADPSLCEFTGPGPNQNAILLATAGQTVISNDDDVYARPGRLTTGDPGAVGPADAGDPRPVVHRDDPYPYQFGYFADRTALLQAITVERVDIVGEHAALLGGSVRITTAGAYGDSGMRSASSFLTLTGEQREQYYADYETLRLTREIARIPDTTVIGRSPHLMGAHFGVDNTRVTPPVLPAGRNADGLLGVTMRITDPDSRTAFLGFGVLHDPPEPRTGDHADLVQVRPAAADLLIVLSVFCQPPGDVTEPSDRLRLLGENLAEVGGLSTGSYLEAVHSAWSRGVTPQVEAMERLLDTYDHAPAIWAKDLEEHVENIYEILREPSALFSGREGPRSVATMQSVTTRWGRLLSLWPDLWEFFAARNRDADASDGRPGGEPLLVHEW